MPRIFTGIEIPAATRDALAILRGGLPGARWIDAENYHITLRFIGDVDGRTADEIAEMLTLVHRPPFSLAVAGLDFFGSRVPHALIARIAPSRELSELQAEQERSMQRLGLRPEARKFTPHVTLARLRGTNGKQMAAHLSGRGGLSLPPFSVDRFALFSARDSVGGGPYVIEATYPLSGEQPDGPPFKSKLDAPI